MTVYPDHKFRWIHDVVKLHFSYLLRQGFQIISIMFTDHSVDDWQVMMLSGDCFVRLRCERGRISLGLSTLQLCNQVGFFDLKTLLQFTFDLDEPFELPEPGHKNEGQQLEEIARLFGKHSKDVFTKFDVLTTLILDRVWIISKPNANGRSSMEDRPLTVYG